VRTKFFSFLTTVAQVISAETKMLLLFKIFKSWLDYSFLLGQLNSSRKSKGADHRFFSVVSENIFRIPFILKIFFSSIFHFWVGLMRECGLCYVAGPTPELRKDDP
jgi:hypothetical protein